MDESENLFSGRASHLKSTHEDFLERLVENESLEREYVRHFLSVFAGQRRPGADRRAVKITQFMTKHPVTVRASDSIKEAVERMEKGHFRHLPVVDEEGKLIGMISDRDIRLIYPSPIFVRPEHTSSQLLMIKVRQAAVFSPVAIGPEASIEEATKLMLQREGGRCPW